MHLDQPSISFLIVSDPNQGHLDGVNQSMFEQHNFMPPGTGRDRDLQRSRDCLSRSIIWSTSGPIGPKDIHLVNYLVYVMVNYVVNYQVRSVCTWASRILRSSI